MDNDHHNCAGTRRTPTVFLTDIKQCEFWSQIFEWSDVKRSAAINVLRSFNCLQLYVLPSRFPNNTVFRDDAVQSGRKAMFPVFSCQNLKSFKLFTIINYSGDITQNDDTNTEFALLKINTCISCHWAHIKKEATFWHGPNNFRSSSFNSYRNLVLQSSNSVTPSSLKYPNFPFFLLLKK